MLNLLIVAPLLISLCAAATRVITGISIEMALLISSPAWIGLLVMTHRTWSSCSDRFQRARYPAIGIALLCVAPFLVFPSHGFVNLGTADGGNHMRFYQSFITDAPDVYHGFVGFYGLLFLTQKLLGVFPEVALLVALGYTIVTLTWLLSLWGLSRGVSTLSVIALNLIVIIPTALALQTNGFYPQLYGLSALVLYLTLCDRPLEVRSIVLLTFLGAGLLRYSYGLTIADLFLASGVYALVRRRPLVSALFLALGVYTATRLLPVITLPGAFTPFHTVSLITAVTLLILGTRERTGLPILLVASSLTVWLTLGVTMGFEHYYVQKYPMGLCLLTGALSLQTLAAAGSAHRKLIVGSLLVLCVAVYPYTKGAIDIVRGRFVNPEVDLTLIHEIRTSLAAANKPFRAFIGSKWPRTNMVNAIFNHEYPYQDYVTGTLPVGAGCLFFDATDGIVNRLKKDRLPELSRAIDTLLREQHTRTTYAAPWNDEGSLTLGMTCER